MSIKFGTTGNALKTYAFHARLWHLGNELAQVAQVMTIERELAAAWDSGPEGRSFVFKIIATTIVNVQRTGRPGFGW